jgi:hypothetical protein
MLDQRTLASRSKFKPEFIAGGNTARASQAPASGE